MVLRFVNILNFIPKIEKYLLILNIYKNKYLVFTASCENSSFYATNKITKFSKIFKFWNLKFEFLHNVRFRTSIFFSLS